MGFLSSTCHVLAIFLLFSLPNRSFATTAKHSRTLVSLLRCAGNELLRDQNAHCTGFCKKIASAFNGEKIAQFKLTTSDLDTMKSFYKKLPVPPLIFKDFLHFKLIVKGLQSGTNYFAWLPAEYTYIKPNRASVELLDLATAADSSNVKQLKDRSEGLALISYFVHPSLLESSGEEVPQIVTNTGQIMGQLEQTSSTPYLASILDLTSQNIDHLKALRSEMLMKLIDTYGYNPEKDKLSMYFHFPYGAPTATLHLHARVNFPAHPLDALRSYSIDEVIDYLEGNRGVKQLILDRQEFLGGSLYHRLDKATKFLTDAGIFWSEIKNPFRKKDS